MVDPEGADASLSIKFGIMKPVIALDMELAALKYLQDLFPKMSEGKKSKPGVFIGP